MHQGVTVALGQGAQALPLGTKDQGNPPAQRNLVQSLALAHGQAVPPKAHAGQLFQGSGEIVDPDQGHGFQSA